MLHSVFNPSIFVVKCSKGGTFLYSVIFSAVFLAGIYPSLTGY